MTRPVLGFRGYAALFDRVDRVGDVMRRGAFIADDAPSQSSPARGGPARPVPLLLQHRGAPVGSIDTMAEDERGLRVSGSISDPAIAAQVRAGALAGLSVGYRPVTARQGAYRELTRVDLVEVSLVAIPMQPLARIDMISTKEQTHE